MAKIASQRNLFDTPDDIAYFNCAAASALLIACGDPPDADTRRRARSRREQFFQDSETVQRLAAGLFGGDAQGYAIAPSVSYGLHFAARMAQPRLRRGDRIVVLRDQCSSKLLPYARAAHNSGASITVIGAPTGGNWTQAILDTMDRTVRVVVAPSCHPVTGANIDLAAIGAACHTINALFVVDATPSLGAVPLSIETVRPDILVAGGHKWLLCPHGFSLAYIAERWRDDRARAEIWPTRTTGNTTPSAVDDDEARLPILSGAIRALEQIRGWGVPSIAESLGAINGRIARHIEPLGFRLLEPALRSPHVLAGVVPESYPPNLADELRRRNIFIGQHGNTVQFAPHLHIGNFDVERLLFTLIRLSARGRVDRTSRTLSCPVH